MNLEDIKGIGKTTIKYLNELGIYNVQDLINYYHIQMYNRDLNYEKFYPEGDGTVRQVESYTSNNTRQLDIDGMIELLERMGEIEE